MDKFIEVFNQLDLSQLLTIIMSAFIAGINVIIVALKTKKSSLEKKLISLNNQTINEATSSVLSNYYILTPDKILYDINDCQFISKDISIAEYQKYKKGGSLV